MMEKFIGTSDIASLIFKFGEPGNVTEVDFGQDGYYTARIASRNERIPAQYRLVAEGKNWLKVYDDTGLTYESPIDKLYTAIKVYRRRDLGCIIQLCEEL